MFFQVLFCMSEFACLVTLTESNIRCRWMFHGWPLGSLDCSSRRRGNVPRTCFFTLCFAFVNLPALSQIELLKALGSIPS